jgi:hypothetical protein
VQIIENLEGEINSVGCNELQFRSGCTIYYEESNIHQEKENENILQPTITPLTVVIMEEAEKGGNIVEKQSPDKDVTPPPPFPEIMMIEKPIVYSNFDIIGELKNLYVNIPLLQALQDMPIYEKTIKELCVKKPIKKVKNPSIVHMVGAFSDLILAKQDLVKYADPRNPIVIV